MRLARTLILAAALTVPAFSAEIDPKSPEVLVTTVSTMLQSKDLVAAFATLPKEIQNSITADYAANQKKPVDPAQDAKFNEFLTKMLADGAVDKLVAEAKPGLAEYDPSQITMGLQMMGGMGSMMLSKPKPGQKKADPVLAAYGQAVQGLATAAAQWIPNADLGSEEKLRGGATHLVAALKALKITSAAEMRALSLNDLLGRLGPALTKLKAAATVYDVNIDAFLASVKVIKATDNGAAKALTIGFTAFDAPFQLPIELEKDAAGGWALSSAFKAKFEGLQPGGGRTGQGVPPAGVEGGVP